MLAFSVAGVRLGLDAASTVEVVPGVELVAAPEMPPLLRGFLRVADRLIPVIRLEKLLHGAADEAQDAAMRLSDRVIIARLQDGQVAWVAGPDMEPLVYRTRDVMPLPADHVLNNCASHVLPQIPPVILLNADKLLLESERLRLEQLRQMTVERTALLQAEIPGKA